MYVSLIGCWTSEDDTRRDDFPPINCRSHTQSTDYDHFSTSPVSIDSSPVHTAANSGVTTGLTGVDMSTQLLPEGVPEIHADPLSLVYIRESVTGTALDLQSTGRGFKSYLGQKLGQVVHTSVPLFTKQYNLVPAKEWWCSAAGKVTAGPAESNGSLPSGWLPVHRDQLLAQRSVTSMGNLYLLIWYRIGHIIGYSTACFSASDIEIDKFCVWHWPVVHLTGKFQIAVHVKQFR